MTELTVSSPMIRRSAWLVWLGLAVVMSCLSLSGDQRSVTPAYRSATLNWIDGKPLYNMHGSGFIYAPQTALVFAPWGLLPIAAGEIAWRCSIIAVFALGVARLTRLICCDDRWFLVNTLVSAVNAVGCVRNGQATLMIAGLMMLACVDIKNQRWTRATLLLSLAITFKPTALILILLAGALYWPLFWRLAISLPLVALAPFATQQPSYVISQFQAFFENSRIAFEIGETGYWAQFFGMLKVAGWDVPSHLQELTRVIVGLATLAACWFGRHRLQPARSAYYLYAISTCYLMLFNSRTEGCTYAMVAPVYGILLCHALTEKGRRLAVVSLIAAVVATAFNFDLALLAVERPKEVWLCPLICLLVTISLLTRFAKDLRATQASALAGIELSTRARAA